MSAVRTKCPHCAAVIRLRNEKLIGRELRCPRCSEMFTASRVSATPSRKTRSTAEQERAGSSGGDEQHGESGLPDIRTNEPGPSVTARRGRRRRSAVPSIVFFLVVVLVAGGAAWWATRQSVPPPETAVALPEANPSSDDLHVAQEQLAERAVSDFTIGSPTDGAPLSLDYIPVVPHLLLHLRPAEIWSADDSRREFVATLGDLGTWLQDFIQRSTRFEPQEIEELMVAVNFGSRTGPPDVAAVTRLVDEHLESQLLLERIRGTLIRDLPAEVYESDDLAFLVVNRRTVVSGSRDLAEDLAEAQEFGAVPMPEMESMIATSDRRRHATLMLDLTVFDAHKDLLLMPQLQTLAEDAVLWLGTDCRILGWSVHLEPHMYMQTSVFPAAELTPRVLERRLTGQLEALPEQLLTRVRGLQPQTVGRQKVVGRFPAMIQALVTATQVSQTGGSATLTTLLPQKAAANLAAGATLTWNESERPSSGSPAAMSAAPPRPAQSVEQRLQQTLLIDFRRTPLHEAFDFIAGEVDVQAVIDGDALKIAGLTQNMAQTHNLGDVSALQALDAILQQYDGVMVIVVDEDTGSVLLTTQAAADRKGLTVYDTAE